ncbi:MAG: PQQ-binding-like beta-propeller repeat protein [Pirellulaceae bacterium]
MTTDQPTIARISSLAAAPRWIPGLAVRFTVAICLILIVVVRTLPRIDRMPAPLNDMAVANILTLIFAFLAAMTLLCWFSFVSSYSAGWRRGLLIGAIALAGLFVVSIVLAHFQIPMPVRYVGVDGNMVPRFEPGWSPAADQVVGKLQPVAHDARADLTTTTDDDFPQFLGPNRDCYLPGPELSGDWAASPPKLLWKRPIGAGWSGFAAVNGFAVTLEQRGDQEWVACYEIATGKPVWGHAIEARHYNPLGGLGPRSTPTLHGGRVYALGATGVLRCLDGQTGKLLWKDDLRKRYGLSDAADEALVSWGRAASPLIVDALVVVPAGGLEGKAKSLVAFRAETGEVAWQGGNDQIGYASPALATLAGVRQILSVNEATASGHDPKTGEVLWSHPWPGHSNQDACASQPVALAGDRVLLSKGYGGGAEVISLATTGGGKLTAKTVWADRLVLETKFTNVTVIDGHIYGLSGGILECVAAESGERRWKKGRYGHGQILGVGDKILVQDEDGLVALVEANPEKFVELASFPALDGQTWNNLCLYGNKLLVRNATEAACYELP